MGVAHPDVISTVSENVVRLWNLGEPITDAQGTILPCHRSPIGIAQFSNDGRWLLTTSSDGQTRRWDLRARDIPQSAVLLPEPRTVAMAIISPNSRWLATLGEFNRHGADVSPVRLWKWTAEPHDLRPVPLNVHTQTVCQFAFDPKSRWLVTASADHTAALWNLASLEDDVRPIRLLGHEEPVDHLVVSPNGHWLVTGSLDGRLRFWDLEAPLAGAASAILTASGDPLRSVTVSPNGRWLFACNRQAGHLWDLQSHKHVTRSRRLGNGPVTVNAAMFTHDSRQLFTAAENGEIKVWSNLAISDDTTATVLQPPASAVDDLALSADEQWLAAAGADHTVRLWQVKHIESSPQVLRGHSEAVLTLDFDPSGKHLASGSQDRTVRVWRLDALGNGQPSSTFTSHSAGVFLVRFSSNGRWLVTGTLDGRLQLQDVSDGDLSGPRFLLNENERPFDAVCVSPDGGLLAATDSEGAVWLWDLLGADPCQSLRKLYGQPCLESTVSISPDSRWLAVGNETGAVRFWNLKLPNSEAMLLHGHQGAVSMVSFTADSRRLITSSRDGSVRLWNLRLEDLLEQAAHVAGRNFSPAEWRELFADIPYKETFHIKDSAE